MLNNRSNKDTLTHLFPLREVDFFVGGGKKLGCIMVLEENKSRERYIQLWGRTGWFSSSDPEMDMKIQPADIEQIMDCTDSIRILLLKSKFNSIDVKFKNHEDKDKCYKVISNMIVNYKEPKKGGFITDMSSNDYSNIDASTKEELAERVAMVALKIENLCHVVDQQFVLEDLVNIRRDLIQLVHDLGGHPAFR